MAEQTSTPLDVLVAHQRQDIGGCLCGWSELGQSFCQHQIDALDAAEFAIVRKPTNGDRLAAAIAEAERIATIEPPPSPRATALGIIAAAAAADGRTADDLDETVIAETLRVAAESAYQQEGGYWIEGFTDDLAHAVVAALRGDTDG